MTDIAWVVQTEIFSQVMRIWMMLLQKLCKLVRQLPKIPALWIVSISGLVSNHMLPWKNYFCYFPSSCSPSFLLPKAGLYPPRQNELYSPAMVVFANAAAVVSCWNMIISYPFPVAARGIPPTYSCCVENATGANRIVVFAKCTTNR